MTSGFSRWVTSQLCALLNSPASEHSPKFSPDGRWLAYVSEESGRAEVYVRRYPQGDKLPVSTGGGNGPVRGPDPQGTREIVLVQNWFEEVKRLAPSR